MIAFARHRVGWAAALILALSAGTASAQLPALRDRPLSAAERTRLTTLESQFARVSQQRNVSATAVRAIAAALGERLTTQDPDQLLRAIDERAAELGAARGRISQLERDLEAMDSMRLAQAVGPILTAANAAIEAGELNDAEARLAEAAQRFADARQTLQGRVDQLAGREAEIIAQRAAVRASVFDYTGAAAIYAQAAEVVPATEPVLRWRHRMAQAEALRRAGEETNDIAALNSALDVIRQAQSLAPRETRPASWAATQAQLGRTLAVLGARGGASTSTDAIVAFRAAAEIAPPVAPRSDWIEIRRLLGLALSRSAGPTEREEGVSILRAAHATDPANPEVRQSLATALGVMANSRADPALMQEAIALYRGYLTEEHRRTRPRGWALAQHNLAVALGGLAQTRPAAETWRAAIAAEDAALAATDREQFPAFWARSRGFTALLFDGLAGVEGGAAGRAHFDRAIAIFDEVLAGLDPVGAPAQWAQTQQARSQALMRRGAADGDATLLQAAIAGYRRTGEVFTRERAPGPWGHSQVGVAEGLLHLAERGPAAERGARIAEARTALASAAESAAAVADVRLAGLVQAQTRRADALAAS